MKTTFSGVRAYLSQALAAASADPARGNEAAVLARIDRDLDNLDGAALDVLVEQSEEAQVDTEVEARDSDGGTGNTPPTSNTGSSTDAG